MKLRFYRTKGEVINMSIITVRFSTSCIEKVPINLPKRKQNLTEDTYSLIDNILLLGYKNGDKKQPIGGRWATATQHIADAIERGTINPMEGYEAYQLMTTTKYYPAWVETRESTYQHLL
jgi:hypothetical protein